MWQFPELIDRMPVPSGTVGVPPRSIKVDRACADSCNFIHARNAPTYPEPPGDFRITPDVETLWNRYDGYREGPEPLLTMGYFCFTVLVTFAGGRAKAAAKYKIEEAVLRKLGQLTSIRGDPRTARKMTTRMQPLSSNEDAWIQETIKQIIWRLGDQRSPATLPTITMAAQPRL